MLTESSLALSREGLGERLLGFVAAPRPYNASSKAAQIAQAVNGSGYGSYFNSLGFLDGFSRQPASWFNVSANYLSIDRPGEPHLLGILVIPAPSESLTSMRSHILSLIDDHLAI